MYRVVDDYEILYMIGEDTDCYEIILNKYKPLIITICNKYLNKAKQIGYELEDLIQVANMGLFEAVRAYNENLNIKFYTYVTSCINNKLNNELRNHLTNKKLCLNTAISYDVTYKDTNYLLLDLIADPNSVDPYEVLNQEYNYLEYRNFINSLPFEVSNVCELKTNGFKPSEILELMDINYKEYQKCIREIKQKLSLC